MLRALLKAESYVFLCICTDVKQDSMMFPCQITVMYIVGHNVTVCMRPMSVLWLSSRLYMCSFVTVNGLDEGVK